jgi:hypothetical protein
VHFHNAAAAGAARASAAEAAVAAAESAAKLQLLHNGPRFVHPKEPLHPCCVQQSLCFSGYLLYLRFRNIAAAGAARASAAEAAVAAAESAAKLNLPVGLSDVEASVQQIDDALFKTLRVRLYHLHSRMHFWLCFALDSVSLEVCGCDGFVHSFQKRAMLPSSTYLWACLMWRPPCSKLTTRSLKHCG